MNPSNRPRSQPQAILHTPSSWGTTALRWGGGRNQHHSPSWQWRFYCDFSLQKFSKVKTASNPEGYHLENSRDSNIYMDRGESQCFLLSHLPRPRAGQQPGEVPVYKHTCCAFTLHAAPVQQPWQRASDGDFDMQSCLRSWERGWGADKSE